MALSFIIGPILLNCRVSDIDGFLCCTVILCYGLPGHAILKCCLVHKNAFRMTPNDSGQCTIGKLMSLSSPALLRTFFRRFTKAEVATLSIGTLSFNLFELPCEQLSSRHEVDVIVLSRVVKSGNRSGFSRILAGRVKSDAGQVRSRSGSGQVIFSSDRCQFRSKQIRSEAVKKQVNSGSDGLQADLIQIGLHHWQIKFRSDLYQIRIEFKSG
ncbi:hypothetical protein F3Y22_tig00002655pilonHSYRG00012 [Hibiscus syriacus]|uniref:Uncharacterized protein n=1 Tax=Hibiscus syriacus TaxID=106335 RepID=A0A6A3CR97_HIBSY|nr:hypothetical protein F3Y22_tig00002655pilonHSYRG00012 [Hibiscus syriacus]